MYHVYNRFARGEDVFADPEEATEFVERLREVKDRDGFTVFAWSLMSNHFHLALRTSSVTLSRTMLHIQGGFSRDFNRRWGRTGPLWQSRYKAKLIDDPGYLSRVITYIHLNPVRAGLADEPSAYSFAGHRELMGRVRSPLCDVDEALLSFGTTLKSARREYTGVLRTLMAGDDPGLEIEVGGSRWWSRDRVLEIDENRHYVDEDGRSTGLERPRLSAEHFVTLACELLDADLEEVASRRQDRAIGVVRRLIASCGIERWRQNAGELARVLRKHPVVVSRWVGEARQLAREDGGTQDRLDSLDQGLSVTALERLHEVRAEEQES